MTGEKPRGWRVSLTLFRGRRNRRSANLKPTAKRETRRGIRKKKKMARIYSPVVSLKALLAAGCDFCAVDVPDT